MRSSFRHIQALPLLMPACGLVVGIVLARCAAIDFKLFVVLLVLLLFACLKWKKTLLLAGVLGMVYGLSGVVLDMQRIAVPLSWLGHKIQITATISEVREGKSYTRLRLKEVRRSGESKDMMLTGFADVYVYQQRFGFLPDMQIQARAKFHVPHNKLNPAGFDYAAYCFDKHIALLGSVSGQVQVLRHDLSWLTQLRQKVRHALAEVDADAKGVLSALLLADRSQIPLHIDDAFAASGATHLLAISGLHVGLVAGWGFLLCWWLLTRRENWIVRLPVRTLSLAFGVALAMAYATLAGWPIPAQRAILMLLAGVLAWWFRASQVPLNTMFAALILIVLWDSSSVLSVSLWLSFLATAALLIWAGSRASQAHDVVEKAIFWCKGMFVVSIVASLATLPLIAVVFERFPVWSLLANALLVPLYALWILPLALLGELAAVLDIQSGAVLMFELAALGIAWANMVLLWIYDLPAGNLWLRSDLHVMHIFLAILLLFSGALWLQKRKYTAALLIICSLLVHASVLLYPSKLDMSRLFVWDVGQGASALLRVPNLDLLVDVPGKKGSKFNGGTTAAENMRALGILKLDAVVLSHAQSDHAGGILRLLASLNEVKQLWLADVPDNHQYGTIKQAIKHVEEQGGSVRWLKQGDVIQVSGGTTIDVLWPPQHYAPSNGNNTSLVLAITLTTGQRLLFPGDMQKQVERQITPSLQAFDVVLMPHHGSKTSSTAAFVQATQAQIVIAQTGYRNHYGFPKREVVARYHSVGSQILNTAEGAVQLSFSDQGIRYRQFQADQSLKREAIWRWYVKMVNLDDGA